ncbi:alpha/beta fold hydrolase [Desulforhabdus sp. TSK]|uniref:alpha/beta hydrolase family protein n=1 Tax=Desulforhabdus sp. TSK TaxID=2925014 RepID=UPI001FC88409|nr:alpha/beta fold hydrolase [Desulforhabdus sp. TSK]GKT10640.1 alpha/beta hydrolase [Desulforhabdus sp. TSK]
MKTVNVTIPIGRAETVSGILTLPETAPNGTGVILAHGAGNDMTHPMMEFLGNGLAHAGYTALRFNFLYRDKGKKAPDKQDLLYSAWEGAYRFLAEHRETPVHRIVAAGKSMGGRIVSQMAAEGKLPADRLIFLGYPLHPAGQKDKLRDGHLYDIAIPMLFFAGTRDPLCDLDLLKKVLPSLKSSWKLEIIEGGDHSFNVPKSAGMGPEAIHGIILERMLRWIEA